MNKDFQHSPPSHAEQTALEILDLLNGPLYLEAVDSKDDDVAGIAAIIQQAIDRSVAEAEEKYRKLARKFRTEQALCGKMADESSDAEHVRNLRAKEIHRGQAAYEIESLIPKQEGEK